MKLLGETERRTDRSFSRQLSRGSQQHFAIRLVRSQRASQEQIVATIFPDLANGAVQQPEDRIEPPHYQQQKLEPVDPEIPSTVVRQLMRENRSNLLRRQ